MTTERVVRWERLTGPDVAAMAKETNMALLPVGCMEMHGPHLPTGTDAFRALDMCERAARLEPAIVLPPIFYNVNDEMQCYPGTIHVSQDTLTRLYHEICLECARNGFNRIIFLIGHGGSEPPIDRLMGDALERRNRTGKWDYFAVRAAAHHFFRDDAGQYFANPDHGHGGAIETSGVLAAEPDLVHLDRVERPPVCNTSPFRLVRPRVPWIRLVPLGYSGDPRDADRDKGNQLIDVGAKRLADLIRRFKSFDPESDY